MPVAQHYGKAKKKKTYKKYEDLLDFRLWLISQGVYSSRVTYSLKGVDEFKKTGMEVTPDNLCIFRQQLRDSGVNERNISIMMHGIDHYILYLKGEDTEWKKNHFVCDEDCFNCKFPDCVMP